MQSDSDTPDLDYEVGYGRPPKAGQFKRGVSGNPRGRRKRPPSIERTLDDILRQKTTISIDGKPRRVRRYEAIMRRVFDRALRGNPPAMKLALELMKRSEDASAESAALVSQIKALTDCLGPDEEEPAQ